jgi:hypothetical protein
MNIAFAAYGRHIAELGRHFLDRGDLNDITVHEKTIAAISLQHQRSDPSRVFAAGLLTGREDARVEAAIAAANEA